MPDAFRLTDIPDGGTFAAVLASGERVCLIRQGDKVSALRDECAHQGMPLSAGEVLPDGTIECPWHGARFDCLTGVVQQGPATDALTAYPVRIEGNRVLVGPPELRS